MKALKLTTCQAINTVPVSQAIAGYLSQRLGIPVEFVGDIHWRERYRLLDAGQIDIGWICGLPYVVRFDQLDSNIELLAAPVMQAKRYQDRPIYFSDVVVRHDSPFKTFADLRGASWAYNEPGSQSGYNITRYHLAVLGETSGFFGRVIGTGAHRLSLRLILKGKIDASAIDSTVLEWELHHHPEIGSQIRIIETLGPSPIPPLVVLKSVPQEIRQQLRRLLLQMEKDAEGRAILAIGHLARFVAVQDRDYDPIRHMARQAAQVAWAANIS
ncbi:MAG: phosphate/phosphite/phosphonate ABC transporter substrate-binding protein [Anaerolineae bacterium]